MFSINLKAEEKNISNANVSKLLEHGYVIKGNWYGSEDVSALDNKGNTFTKKINVIFFYLVKPTNYNLGNSGNVKSTQPSIKICKVQVAQEKTICITP